MFIVEFANKRFTEYLFYSLFSFYTKLRFYHQTRKNLNFVVIAKFNKCLPCIITRHVFGLIYLKNIIIIVNIFFSQS